MSDNVSSNLKQFSRVRVAGITLEENIPLPFGALVNHNYKINKFDKEQHKTIVNLTIIAFLVKIHCKKSKHN